jgi:outer membrane protein OmpA-like peptidoglycan-associated protein
MIVVSDRAITVAVNLTTQKISADTLMMVGASISHIYVKNTDANNTATISYVVTD